MQSLVFSTRCYASAVLAMAMCLCLSQVGVLLKRLNVGSHKQHQTRAQGIWFSDAKDLCEIRPGSHPTGAPNACNGGIVHDLKCPITTPFSAFCTAIYRFVTGEPRDFKFRTLTYHSKSHPADEKYSLTGAWSGSGDPF